MNRDIDCCTDAVAESQQSQTLFSRARLWIATPRGLTIAGIALVAVGLALNWSWLVAVGAAPLILSLAPCAAMCALGLCMNMRGHPNPPVQKSNAVRSAKSPPDGIEGQAFRGL